MDKICETNVLILGKTGVGKTSLFNYIFGVNLMKTGAGRPVTGMGLFEETIHLNPNLILHLYDSWGLEADKSETWKALVQEALDQHDVREIKDWFHTIIYCLSAKSARVEDFDLEMISTLAQEGNPVLVVLTHCDVMNVESAIAAMRKVITEKTPVKNQDIVEVSNHAKKLLGGKQTQAFGKETIIHRIKVNLLGSISSKMPKILEAIGHEKINQWYRDCLAVIEKNVSYLNPVSAKKEKTRNEYFDIYAQDIFDEITRESDALFNEAYDYYNAFSSQFLGNTLVEVSNQQRTPQITHFQVKKSDKIVSNIAGTIFLAVPVIGLLGKFAIREKTKAYYREGLRQNKALLENQLATCVAILQDELKRINSGLSLETESDCKNK